MEGKEIALTACVNIGRSMHVLDELGGLPLALPRHMPVLMDESTWLWLEEELDLEALSYRRYCRIAILMLRLVSFFVLRRYVLQILKKVDIEFEVDFCGASQAYRLDALGTNSRSTALGCANVMHMYVHSTD